MTDELKPDDGEHCPFCGLETIELVDDKVCYCHDCGASAWIEMWGKRPIEDALRAEVEELRAELDRMKDANRWFSVEERLPEDFQPNGETKDDYEVMTAGGFVVSPCYYSELNFWCFCYNSEYVGVDKVTHWRPMPAPPEASDGD